ncbi:hypothetical protein ES703_27987 [subsurface metagenome]
MLDFGNIVQADRTAGRCTNQHISQILNPVAVSGSQSDLNIVFISPFTILRSSATRKIRLYRFADRLHIKAQPRCLFPVNHDFELRLLFFPADFSIIYPLDALHRGLNGLGIISRIIHIVAIKLDSKFTTSSENQCLQRVLGAITNSCPRYFSCDFTQPGYQLIRRNVALRLRLEADKQNALMTFLLHRIVPALGRAVNSPANKAVASLGNMIFNDTLQLLRYHTGAFITRTNRKLIICHQPILVLLWEELRPDELYKADAPDKQYYTGDKNRFTVLQRPVQKLDI